MLVDVKTLAVTVHVVLAIAVAVSVVVTVFKDQNNGKTLLIAISS